MICNDLCDDLMETHANLYADDAVLYCSSESYIGLILSLYIEIDTICHCSKANKLNLSVKKIKLMIFKGKLNLRNVVHSRRNVMSIMLMCLI